MESDRTICVVCAWRQTCNKKFSMDGATSTRCPDFTKDVTLKTDEKRVSSGDESQQANEDS